MTALYQLVAQHRELQAIAEESEIDPQVLLDTLEGLQGDIEAKSRSVAMVVKNLESFADQVDEAAKQMQTRAKRIRERAEGIRTYLKTNMQACGIMKIQCAEFTIALRKNPARADIIDEAAIPDAFREWPEPPPPRINRKAVLDALKAGKLVPGAQLAQDERVDIRA